MTADHDMLPGMFSETNGIVTCPAGHLSSREIAEIFGKLQHSRYLHCCYCYRPDSLDRAYLDIVHAYKLGEKQAVTGA